MPWITLAGIIQGLPHSKYTDIVNDYCSDLMLGFQSPFGLKLVRDIHAHIQRHVVGNVLYSMFTNIF